MKKNDIEHNYVCDTCGKPAKYNLQSQWHKYQILDGGDFQHQDEWEGNTNEFYCEDCYDNKIDFNS